MIIIVAWVRGDHLVAGGFDYLLKVRTRNMAEYRDFLGDTLARMSDIK